MSVTLCYIPLVPAGWILGPEALRQPKVEKIPSSAMRAIAYSVSPPLALGSNAQPGYPHSDINQNRPHISRSLAMTRQHNQREATNQRMKALNLETRSPDGGLHPPVLPAALLTRLSCDRLDVEQLLDVHVLSPRYVTGIWSMKSVQYA